MKEMKLQLRDMEDNNSSFDRIEYTRTPRIAVPAPRIPPFSPGEDLEGYVL